MRNTDSPSYVPSRSSNCASFKWGNFGHSKKKKKIWVYIRYIYYMYACIYININVRFPVFKTHVDKYEHIKLKILVLGKTDS